MSHHEKVRAAERADALAKPGLSDAERALLAKQLKSLIWGGDRYDVPAEARLAQGVRAS